MKITNNLIQIFKKKLSFFLLIFIFKFLSTSRDDISEKSKKTAKTVLFIKKPVDAFLYNEFLNINISGFPFR